MTTTLIRGGTVVLGQRVAQGDVLIRDETIAAIGDLRDVAADTVMGRDSG